MTSGGRWRTPAGPGPAGETVLAADRSSTQGTFSQEQEVNSGTSWARTAVLRTAADDLAVAAEESTALFFTFVWGHGLCHQDVQPLFSSPLSTLPADEEAARQKNSNKTPL